MAGAPAPHSATHRTWVFALIYFGLVYGLYALTFFLPTIIGGFEAQFGSKFNVFQKGVITAVPYLPAAAATYLWTQAGPSRGAKLACGPTGRSAHASIPCALSMTSPAMTIAVITVTACADLRGLASVLDPSGTVYERRGAAAGVAFINMTGNIGGFAAPYITGAMKDATGSYASPMFMVGGLASVVGIPGHVHCRKSGPATAGDGAVSEPTSNAK